jgi:hypothetical protein
MMPPLLNLRIDSTTKALHHAPPPTAEADATIFHEAPIPNAPTKVCHFVGTVNLGFTILEDKRSNSNVAILLKRFMKFTKQMDADFRIETLNDSV